MAGRTLDLSGIPNFDAEELLTFRRNVPHTTYDVAKPWKQKSCTCRCSWKFGATSVPHLQHCATTI